MDVRLPDGTMISNVPEGITQTELMSRVDKMRAAAPETQIATPAEAIAGNPVTRFALGAAAPVLGAAQLLTRINPLTGQVNPDQRAGTAIDANIRRLEEMKKAGMAASGNEGFDIAGLAGNVLSPAFLGAAKAIPAAATYAGKVGQGMTLGGAAGLTAPVTGGDYATEKASQTAAGAAVGGAIPAVAPLITGAGNILYHGLIEPWANPAAIKGRAFLAAAGDKADEIISLLRGNKQIVPGSLPTAGEAAVPSGSVEFAALQKSASKVSPGASDYLARSDKQNAARLAQVRTVGQDKATLAAAEAQRTAEANVNYATAYAQAVKADPKLAQIASNPYFRDAIPDAMKLSEAKGIDPKQNLTEFLHIVKLSLDKQLMKSGDTALSGVEKREVYGVKKELVDWLAAKNNPYEIARAKFAAASAPINQMQVGQTLEQKLIPAIDESASQKAGVYAQALRDAPQTIKKATGQPRFDELTQVLNSAQMAAVNSVKEDLARSARFELMAKKGGAAPNALDLATQSLEQQAGGKVPNLLSRTAMITNAIIDRLQGKIDKKLAAEIATEMLNPPKVAESIANAQFRVMKNKAIAERVRQMTLPATLGGIQSMQQQP